MEYKVVPFTANITRKDTTATVASQLQTMIQEQAASGWEYVRLESVETNIAPELGCFGVEQSPS